MTPDGGFWQSFGLMWAFFMLLIGLIGLWIWLNMLLMPNQRLNSDGAMAGVLSFVGVAMVSLAVVVWRLSK